MLDCVARLRRGDFDGAAHWLMDELMGRYWGYTDAVQRAIDGLKGVDSIFVKARQSYFGYGADDDEPQAFRLFSEGVKAGDPSGRCQAMLASCYKYGEGCTRNIERAVELLREAVEVGNPRAQCGLGFMYFQGAGVEQSKEEARRLYELSHRQGYVFATSSLSNLCRGTPEEVPLLIEAATRGQWNASKRLSELQENDAERVVPYGYWAPHVHRWTSERIDREMVCLLMASKRADGLLRHLPKPLLLHICFYIACRPAAYQPTADQLARAEQVGWRWKMERKMEAMQTQLQQQMSDLQAQLQRLLAIAGRLEGDAPEAKRRRN